MMHPNKKYEEVSDIELNPMDKSSLSNLILGYTPVDNITSSIMQRVSSDHLPDGTVVFLKKIDFIYAYVVCICVSVRTCVCRYSWRPEEPLRFLGAKKIK